MHYQTKYCFLILIFSLHICLPKEINLQECTFSCYEELHNQVHNLFLTKAKSEQKQVGNQLLTVGNNFFHQGKIEQACNVYRVLNSLFPHSTAILYNLGRTYTELNQIDDACNAYQSIISREPNNHEVLFALSTAYLTLGDYENGWKLYEHRWKLPDKQADPISIEHWDGSNISGKTILLRSEGGLGDTIQFIRYAQIVKNYGATVLLQTSPHLKQLLSRCPYLNQILTHHDPIPQCDVQASLMSLPALLKTTVDTIPQNIPYIFPDHILVKQWEPYFDKQYCNIGICWQADPHNDANRPPLAQRSIPLELFKHLTELPHVRLFSLQNIDGMDQLDQCKSNDIYSFNALDKKNGRFMDTAALIQNLNLIITVDTSIAHLAGALGKPTWLILPFKSDWRWMIDRNDSPWYPTMRIFRRKKEDTSWKPIMKTIVQELKSNKDFYVTNNLN